MSQCSTSRPHNLQSTSNSSSNTNDDINGGHCASPYLRRFRLPKLNTYRHHLEDEDEDDEWFEIQMAKNDLIKLRMKELNIRYKESKNNNNNSPCSSPPTTNHTNMTYNNDDINGRSSNGNMSPSSSSSFSSNSCISSRKRLNSMQMMETQTCQRPFFHPKHLFTMQKTTGASTKTT